MTLVDRIVYNFPFWLGPFLLWMPCAAIGFVVIAYTTDTPSQIPGLWCVGILACVLVLATGAAIVLHLEQRKRRRSGM